VPSVIAAHAVITRQRIHDRVLERMAHVEGAGDIRRWDNDGVRSSGAARFEASLCLQR
jgi:hypothetical protein